MSRKPTVKDLQAQEAASVGSPLRRSSRILIGPGTPQSTSNDAQKLVETSTPNKTTTRTRRLSTQSTDDNAEPAQKQGTTARRGRRTSVTSETSDKDEQPAKAVRTRRTSQQGTEEEAKTPAKRTTRGRKNSDSSESAVENPQPKTTRGRQSSVTDKEEAGKPALRRSRRLSSDSDTVAVVTPKTPKRVTRRSSLSQEDETEGLQELEIKLTPIKKVGIVQKVQAELDLSIINESEDVDSFKEESPGKRYGDKVEAPVKKSPKLEPEASPHAATLSETSKLSLLNSSDKENIGDNQTPSIVVSRVSNVFKPTGKKYSFCEPMEVDESIANLDESLNTPEGLKNGTDDDVFVTNETTVDSQLVIEESESHLDISLKVEQGTPSRKKLTKKASPVITIIDSSSSEDEKPPARSPRRSSALKNTQKKEELVTHSDSTQFDFNLSDTTSDDGGGQEQTLPLEQTKRDDDSMMVNVDEGSIRNDVTMSTDLAKTVDVSEDGKMDLSNTSTAVVADSKLSPDKEGTKNKEDISKDEGGNTIESDRKLKNNKKKATGEGSSILVEACQTDLDLSDSSSVEFLSESRREEPEDNGEYTERNDTSRRQPCKSKAAVDGASKFQEAEEEKNTDPVSPKICEEKEDVKRASLSKNTRSKIQEENPNKERKKSQEAEEEKNTDVSLKICAEKEDERTSQTVKRASLNKSTGSKVQEENPNEERRKSQEAEEEKNTDASPKICEKKEDETTSVTVKRASFNKSRRSKVQEESPNEERREASASLSLNGNEKESEEKEDEDAGLSKEAEEANKNGDLSSRIYHEDSDEGEELDVSSNKSLHIQEEKAKEDRKSNSVNVFEKESEAKEAQSFDTEAYVEESDEEIEASPSKDKSFNNIHEDRESNATDEKEPEEKEDEAKEAQRFDTKVHVEESDEAAKTPSKRFTRGRKISDSSESAVENPQPKTTRGPRSSVTDKEEASKPVPRRSRRLSSDSDTVAVVTPKTPEKVTRQSSLSQEDETEELRDLQIKLTPIKKLGIMQKVQAELDEDEAKEAQSFGTEVDVEVSDEEIEASLNKDKSFNNIQEDRESNETDEKEPEEKKDEAKEASKIRVKKSDEGEKIEEGSSSKNKSLKIHDEDGASEDKDKSFQVQHEESEEEIDVITGEEAGLSKEQILRAQEEMNKDQKLWNSVNLKVDEEKPKESSGIHNKQSEESPKHQHSRMQRQNSTEELEDEESNVTIRVDNRAEESESREETADEVKTSLNGIDEAGSSTSRRTLPIKKNSSEESEREDDVLENLEHAEERRREEKEASRAKAEKEEVARKKAERRSAKKKSLGFVTLQLSKPITLNLDDLDSSTSSSPTSSNDAEEDDIPRGGSSSSSSSGEFSNFIDGMAEEGEEETPSEDSNDIVDDGESVGSSNSGCASEEEDYDMNDSFICDDVPDDLLPGDEYDLDVKTTSPKKKTGTKRSRIIRVSESSSSDEREVLDVSPQVSDHEEPAPRTESVICNSRKSQEEQALPKSKDPESASRESVIWIEDSGRLDESVQLVETRKVEESSHNNSPSGTPRPQRKHSLNIYENIILVEGQNRLDEVKKINTLVETFCSSVKNGEISLNISLEYEGAAEEVTEKSPPKREKLKRKLDKSIGEINEEHTQSKKRKKNEKPAIDNAALSFNLMSDLISDVKNRPKRVLRPTKTCSDSSWTISGAKGAKPSRSSALQREKMKVPGNVPVHPKDFKNRVLSDLGRVKRVETMTLLKKKGAR